MVYFRLLFVEKWPLGALLGALWVAIRMGRFRVLTLVERQTAGAEKVLAAELTALSVGGAQSCSTIGAPGRSWAGACCSQRILKTSNLNHSAVAHGFEGRNYIIVTGRFPSRVPWRGKTSITAG